MHNPDGSKGWYMPNEFDQPAGGCGTDPTGKTSLVYGFSQNIPMNTALYGLTWCPGHFQDPTTKSMGNPGKDPGILTVAQIELYRNTGGTHVLHEFAHMVNNSETIPLLPYVSMILTVLRYRDHRPTDSRSLEW